jgi:hypothetical protein
MSLAASEERALARIEASLRRSDPKLAAMLSTFSRLNQAEVMPRREFLLRPTRMRWLTGDVGPRSNRRRRPRGGPAQSAQSPQAPLMSQRSQLSPSSQQLPAPRAPRPVRGSRTARPSWFSLSPRPSRLPQDRDRDGARTTRGGRPSRIIQILPVIMATCALGLVVVIFTVLNHGKPETMSQTRGTQCVPTVVNSCQPQGGTAGSAGPSAKGRAG